MKRIVGILCIVFLSFSCIVPEYTDPELDAAITAFARNEGISNRETALQWVSNNITYAPDVLTDKKDKWQAPEETLIRRTGDCEDFVILLMAFFDTFGTSSDLIIIRGSVGLHALAQTYDGLVYEAQLGTEVTSVGTILRRYSYPEALWIARFSLSRGL